MCRIAVADAGGPQICAFLDTVAVSEIGLKLLSISDDGYNVLVGSTPQMPHYFSSYADHPNILVKLSDSLSSTAAGRYQILHRYWPVYRDQLNLPDFGPESQDRYAIQQLKEARAIEPIKSANIRTAMNLCSHIWASLPGAVYGQHVNSEEMLMAAYTAALQNYQG